MSGDTAIVGAPGEDIGGISGLGVGAAFIFARDGDTWSEQMKLTAADHAGNDHFGKSVSVSGDAAIVGAYLNDDYATDSGSAYLYSCT